MAKLKGGSSADFSNSMAESIEQAMDTEWRAVKGVALPSAGLEDRKILWAAIANGILNYLKAHQDEILESITLNSHPSETVTHLEVNL